MTKAEKKQSALFFSAYPLHEILKRIRLKMNFGQIVLPDTARLSRFQKFLHFLAKKKWGKISVFATRQLAASFFQLEWHVEFCADGIADLKKYRFKDESYVFLCQVLANRYIPLYYSQTSEPLAYLGVAFTSP